MRPKNRVFCAYAGRPKLLFESKSKAENFIRYNADEIGDESKTGKKPVRSYYCTACGGWHVTSREKLAVRQQEDAKEAPKQKPETIVQNPEQSINVIESTVWMLVNMLDRECNDKMMATDIQDAYKTVVLLDKNAWKHDMADKAAEYKKKIAEKDIEFLSGVLADCARYTEVGASDIHALIRILGSLDMEEEKIRMIKKAKLMQRTLHDRRRDIENRIGFMKNKLRTAFELASNGLMVKAGEIVDKCDKIATEICNEGLLPRKVLQSLEYIEDKIAKIREMMNPTLVVDMSSDNTTIDKKEDGTE